MNTPAAPPGHALDDLARRALKRARRWGLLLITGAAVLFFVASIPITLVQGRADDLTRNGARVAGVVTRCSCPSGDSIDVAFTWQGRQRLERVNLDDSSPSYRRGQTVVVLVDPSNPVNMTVKGEDNEPGWVTALILSMMVTTAGLAVSGLAMLVSTWRKRRLLRAHHWQPVTLGRVALSGNQTWWVAVQTGDGQWRDGKVSGMLPGRLRRVEGIQEALLAGGPTGRGVLRWGDSPSLYTVKLRAGLNDILPPPAELGEAVVVAKELARTTQGAKVIWVIIVTGLAGAVVAGGLGDLGSAVTLGAMGIWALGGWWMLMGKKRALEGRQAVNGDEAGSVSRESGPGGEAE